MKKLLLILGDIFTLYASLIIMLLLRYGADINNDVLISIHVAPFSILFALWLFIFYIAHLYELEDQKNDELFFSNLSKIFVTVSFISVLFFYFAPFFSITPKINLVIFLAIEFVLLTTWRLTYNSILVSRSFRNKAIIIGNNKKVEELFEMLSNNLQLGYKITSIVDLNQITDAGEIIKTIRDQKAKTIILAPEVYKHADVVNALFKLLGHDIQFITLADFAERITGKIPLDAIDQVWFLENITGDNSRLYELLKRVMDISSAVLSIIITSPLMLLAILGIKLSSKGPIFYRQKRTGKNGKAFDLIKFRSMPHNIESATGAIWASAGDNRATFFGKFLRKTRIDELPQVINVLKGELSFVGPRPERPEFHQKLVAEIPFYDKRYLVTPGLTGWAQIKFKLDFEGGMTVKDTAEKVKHDLYYIKNRGILLDVGIILQTFYILLNKVLS